jgi:hypothetical protein
MDFAGLFIIGTNWFHLFLPLQNLVYLNARMILVFSLVARFLVSHHYISFLHVDDKVYFSPSADVESYLNLLSSNV